MQEIWKDIKGFEGLYQVSNLGNVKSLNYRNLGFCKLLTPKCNNEGRLWVDLRKNGKGTAMLVHRLVGMAFIPNPNNFPQINHIDENPKNNVVENLEWCTQEYNIQYYLDRHPERRKKENITYSNKYKERKHLKVNQFTKDGTLVKKWENSATISRETGWSDWSISECCR
jgi:hypothetical protein